MKTLLQVCGVLFLAQECVNKCVTLNILSNSLSPSFTYTHYCWGISEKPEVLPG